MAVMEGSQAQLGLLYEIGKDRITETINSNVLQNRNGFGPTRGSTGVQNNLSHLIYVEVEHKRPRLKPYHLCPSHLNHFLLYCTWHNWIVFIVQLSNIITGEFFPSIRSHVVNWLRGKFEQE